MTRRSGCHLGEAESLDQKFPKSISYRIRYGGTKAEVDKAKEGTKAGRGANFICPISGTAITAEYIRHVGKTDGIGQHLIAMVADTKHGRVYLDPTDVHVAVATSEKAKWTPSLAFDHDALGFRVGNYGMDTFGDLFTDRQTVALTTLTDLISEARAQIEFDAVKYGLHSDPAGLRLGSRGAKAYAEAVSVYLYFCIGKLTDLANSLCRWEPVAQCPRNLFGRHAIPMIWDFAEGNIFSSSSGSWSVVLNGIFKAFDKNTYDYPRNV